MAFPGLLEDLNSVGFEIDIMEVVRRWSVDWFTVFYSGLARVDWMQPVIPLYATVGDRIRREETFARHGWKTRWPGFVHRGSKDRSQESESKYASDS